MPARLRNWYPLMMREFSGRVQTWLGHRRQPAVVITLAVVVGLPALWASLITDEYIHRIRMSPTLHVPASSTLRWTCSCSARAIRSNAGS